VIQGAAAPPEGCAGLFAPAFQVIDLDLRAGNGQNTRHEAMGVLRRQIEGRWIGAKLGFFFLRDEKFNDAGSVDIDWIRFEK